MVQKRGLSMVQKRGASMVQLSDFRQLFSVKGCLDGTTRFSKKKFFFGVYDCFLKEKQLSP